jgi:hypothetical protein
MHEPEAIEIVRQFIIDEGFDPCHIHSIRFIAGEPGDVIPRSVWAAIIRFDDDVDGASTAAPIVSVDDETGDVSMMTSL